MLNTKNTISSSGAGPANRAETPPSPGRPAHSPSTDPAAPINASRSSTAAVIERKPSSAVQANRPQAGNASRLDMIIALTALDDPQDTGLQKLISNKVPVAGLAAEAYKQLDALMGRVDSHQLQPNADEADEPHDDYRLFQALTGRLRTLTAHPSFDAKQLQLQHGDLHMLLSAPRLHDQLLAERTPLRTAAHNALVSPDDGALNRLLDQGADPTWLADQALRLLKRAQSDSHIGYRKHDAAQTNLMQRFATLASRGVEPGRLASQPARQVMERLLPVARAAGGAAQANASDAGPGGNADAAWANLATALRANRWPLRDDSAVPWIPGRYEQR